jgi:hypothetical protein
MQSLELKLKQASAVLGVPPKELQNLVQFGVLRPRRRARVCFFDANVLLQAKVAGYLKESLGTSTQYLVLFTKALSQFSGSEVSRRSILTLCARSAPGKTPLEVRIPIRKIIKELEQRLPLANIYRDIPRGRKRKGWKEEFLRTLKDAASEVGDLSEKQIIESVRSYRSASRLQPEVEVVRSQKALFPALMPS